MIGPVAPIKTLTDRFLRSPMLRASAFALGLRISGAGLLFIFNLQIVKLLGVSDSGIFFLGMTVINIASVFLLLGIDQLVLRSISARSGQEPQQPQGRILARSLQILLFSSLVGAFVLIATSGLLGQVISKPTFSTTLSILSLSLPFLILSSLFGESLRAHKFFKRSVFVTTNCLYIIVIPLLFILGITGRVSLATTCSVFVVASCMYFAISAGIVRNGLGKSSTKDVFRLSPIGEYISTLKESQHLLWASMLYLSMGWIDVLIVGFFLPPEQVSIYAIASRVAKLMTFPLFAVNTIIAPRISYQYSTGNLASLTKESQKSTVLSVVFSLPLLVVFLLVPGFFMGIFGAEFSEGIDVFRLLVIGQAINSFTGAVVVIMSMMKLEKKVNVISAVAVGAQVVLGILLTRSHGLIGMAIGTVIGTAILNIGGVLILLFSHKVNIIPFPRISKLRNQRKTG